MPISKLCKIRVGITMGDPSGIGPEVIAKGLRRIEGVNAEFIIIGDYRVYKKFTLPVPARLAGGRQAGRSPGHPACPCPSGRRAAGRQVTRFIDLNNVRQEGFAFGKIKAEYGRASIEYLDKALELLENGEFDCLVTCPISKEAINLAGFRYSGHTEYLAEKTRTLDFAMMLLNKFLKISLVTRHIPIKAVSGKLNQDNIYRTTILTYRALNKLFLIPNPRIAICGLNPHASDNGVIGKEENTVIKPVLKKLKMKNISIDGPLPSDTAMSCAKKHQYDAIVAMYHDQALIALKLTSALSGVNLTLGLPFVRSSPLHGTAFDIAGRNKADPDSFVAAVKLAVKCASNLKRD